MDRDEMQRQMWHDVDSGWAITAELLSAIFVWTGIGWLLDRWLDTEPWLLAVGALLGFVLGLYLVWVRHEHATREQRERFQYRDH